MWWGYGMESHGLAMIEAIILDFEAGSWALTVNADDDTIRIVQGEATGLEDVRIDGEEVCQIQLVAVAAGRQIGMVRRWPAEGVDAVVSGLGGGCAVGNSRAGLWEGQGSGHASPRVHGLTTQVAISG